MSETPNFHPSAGVPLPSAQYGPAPAENTVDVGAIPTADPDGAGYFVTQLGDGLDMGQ